MCGIWAIVGNTESKLEQIKRLEHRGPEYTACLDVSGTPVSLGFTRLAINGLTVQGHQPFQNEGIFVICNGEIYNYRDLALRWNIPLEQGTSDCAILAGLYPRLKMTEFCRALDGVFAIVLVDTKTETVYVARDPYGVRPLFEGLLPNGSRMWASEIKGLSNNCVTVNPFPPGTWRSYNFQGQLVQEAKYHMIPHTKMDCFNTVGAVHAKFSLRESLVAAVKKRLLSDRPIGALLSGGLDSSLVCAIAAKELAKDGKKLTTFSIGMPGSTDLAFAKKVADHIGSIHHEILVQPEEFLNAIPAVIKAIESYDITSVRASVGNWLLGKYIKENTDIKVVFNGDGSDEIGGGYLYFYKAPSDEEFEAESERLLHEIHLFDVLRSDRSMAAHGLEARTPFLDKSVVATWRAIHTCLRRPSKGMVDGQGIRVEKQILRDAFADTSLLPLDVLYRKKEAFSDGVSSVQDSWYLRCSAYAKQTIRMEDAKRLFPFNTPQTEEAYWYRSLFVEYYGDNRATVIPHMWLPRWVQKGEDPSARTLTEVY
jgi:asparagine synthase (glutamine-hydrolysing)